MTQDFGACRKRAAQKFPSGSCELVPAEAHVARPCGGVYGNDERLVGAVIKVENEVFDWLVFVEQGGHFLQQKWSAACKPHCVFVRVEPLLKLRSGTGVELCSAEE